MSQTTTDTAKEIERLLNDVVDQRIASQRSTNSLKDIERRLGVLLDELWQKQAADAEKILR